MASARWDLDDRAEVVYRAMLRNPGLDLTALGKHLEIEPDVLALAVQSLTEAGFVRTVPGADQAEAVPPGAVLAEVLRTELGWLEASRERLATLRSRLNGFSADHLVGQLRGWSEVAVEQISDDEIAVATEDFQRSTSGEILTCHAVVSGADNPDYVAVTSRQLSEGRPMRAIYPAGVTEDPRRLDYVRRWDAAGEQIRLLQALPPRHFVYGDAVALVSSEWGGAGGSFYVVRVPALVAVVRAVFDAYWQRAAPLPRPSSSWAGEDRRAVLELLALGAKDETIARNLGTSVRTVRRRVAELMDELGAATRFQAGLEAGRRGLV